MILKYGCKTFTVQANDFHTNLIYPIDALNFVLKQNVILREQKQFEILEPLKLFVFEHCVTSKFLMKSGTKFGHFA
jgi:hypothetical protein